MADDKKTTGTVNDAVNGIEEININATTAKERLFAPIQADTDIDNVMVVESLCFSCEQNGETRLLLTNIPHFREVVISSFGCPHCGHTNNDIMPSATVAEQAITYTLKVDGAQDMNRQVVRAGSASFKIVELDFEAPGFTVKGSLTTIEGLFQTAVGGLEQHQIVRRIMEPEIAAKIDEIILKLKEYQAGEIPFTLILSDPSGNSFIENRHFPAADPKMTIAHKNRTREEMGQMGMVADDDEAEATINAEDTLDRRTDYFNEIGDKFDAQTEVLDFPTNCESCQSPVMEHMKMVQIPNFKEVVIMSSTCDSCRHRSVSVKAGGAIEDQGTKITLRMTDPSDLIRDVLKSESCALSIPELDLEMRFSSEGKFTTLEGLLVDIKEDMGRINPFGFGDSTTTSKRNELSQLTTELDKVIAGERLVTIVFDDPVGNSYIQNTYAPEDDPELTIEKYDRTEEQNEEFGIADMKTEDYEN